MNLVNPNLEPWYLPRSHPQTPCNNYFGKKCTYHCQACFLTKGLGISYGRKKRRPRRSAPPSSEDHQNPISKQPLSQTGGDRPAPEDWKRKVRTKTEADPFD
uniref:Protein Tat n=1 Tax=Human immunodeficiency virus type 1 TaxID=11676 RepID=A0A0C5K781_HV1|nr:tat protein [Human immunodeficiency virus 1]